MAGMWIAPERHGLRQWLIPGLALAVGVGIAAAAAAKGHTSTGLIALAVLAGYAAHLAYRRGEGALVISEAFGRGHRARAHLKAAAMTGDILVAAIVGAVIVQTLRGGDLMPYAWLAAVAGVVYAVSALTSGGDM